MNKLCFKVVEQSESERMLDPAARTSSAFSRAGRPGLTKGYSISTPNVATLDGDNAILERIREMELQISNQQASNNLRKEETIFNTNGVLLQDTIASQQRQIADFATGKDTGYESQSNTDSTSSVGPPMANLSLSVSVIGDIGELD